MKFTILVQTICLGFLVNFSAVVDSAAASKSVQVTAPVSSEQLVGNVEYFLDDTRTLDIHSISSPEFADKFQTIESEFIDFGFTKSFIWLKVRLENLTDTDDRFLLYFRENFFPNFNAYQTGHDGEIITITEQFEDSGFESRPVDYPFLVVPVNIKAGEKTDVYVRYSSGGASEVRFTIETEDSFNAIANGIVFKNSIFYGMLALMFMVAGAVFLSSRKAVFFGYAASTLTTLFLIMHLDGTGFQYIWSDWPQFNSNASLYLSLFSIFFGSMFGRAFLQTKRYHKIMDKVFLFLMGVSVIVLATSGFMDTQYLKWLAVLLFPLTHLWYMTAGLVAARTRFKEVRFYVIAWTGVFIGSAGLMAREIIGIEMSAIAIWDTLRVVSVADAAFMGLGLLDRFNQMRISSQKNLKASLRQAKQNLELTQRLSDLEKKFENVTELAENKDAELLNTVHDLRQPLHVLRMKVHDLMQGNSTSNEDFNTVKQTFGYLEGLVSERLADTMSDVIIRDESEDPGRDNELSVAAVLSSIHEMFESDARDKGLELKYEASSDELEFDNLALMRIASNLVSNAIKYTEKGTISFGLSSHERGKCFSVSDTGSGMNAEQFDAALQRNVRLEEGVEKADGNGYGLSIVSEIAEKYGLSIQLNENRQSGSEVQVFFPK